MTPRTRREPSRRTVLRAAAAAAALGAGATAWSSLPGAADEGCPGAAAARPSRPTGVRFFRRTVLHDVRIRLAEDDYAEVMRTFQETGEKAWLCATVSLDGEDLAFAGVRLKGNSSLHTAGPSSDPADLPWLVKLDEYVAGQALDGHTELVLRSSPTRTSLNEAVALDLLRSAGLPSQRAVAAGLSVNGSRPALRLVVENPDDHWVAEHFGGGQLYKAEAGGDWSYRGEDPEAYADAFDQEAGDEDLTPLVDFLRFLNQAGDHELAAGIEERLDVAAFARYLALEELIRNADDIDGPGNNSYLHRDPTSGRFTVVAWDHNLAFDGAGALTGPGAGPGLAGPGPVGPGSLDRQGPTTGSSGGQQTTGETGNVLVERLQRLRSFRERRADAYDDLRRRLYRSGRADGMLQEWVDLLTDQAEHLVPPRAVRREARAIAEVVSGSRS